MSDDLCHWLALLAGIEAVGLVAALTVANLEQRRADRADADVARLRTGNSAVVLALAGRGGGRVYRPQAPPPGLIDRRSPPPPSHND